MDDSTLERAQWDLFWLPTRARAVERPELGYTTSSEDATTLNNVHRARLGPADVEAGIAEVVAAHAGRTSRWSVVDASTPGDLSRRLEDAGYVCRHALRATWVRTDEWSGTPAHHTVRRVRDRATLDAMRDVMDQAFGPRARGDEAPLDAEVTACGPGRRVQRFVVYEDERPVCAGGLSLFPALGFGLLWAGGTVPDARGRGAYRALLGARVQAAREAGIGAVGLYARVETSLPIVQRLGFTTGGWMHSFERPPEAG